MDDVTIFLMIRNSNNRGYYILTTRQATFPPSWRWRLIRRGRPMGVKIESYGFRSYQAARLAGKLALAEFLTHLAEERSRVE